MISALTLPSVPGVRIIDRGLTVNTAPHCTCRSLRYTAPWRGSWKPATLDPGCSSPLQFCGRWWTCKELRSCQQMMNSTSELKTLNPVMCAPRHFVIYGGVLLKLLQKRHPPMKWLFPALNSCSLFIRCNQWGSLLPRRAAVTPRGGTFRLHQLIPSCTKRECVKCEMPKSTWIKVSGGQRNCDPRPHPAFP